jgi:hypothetical protein
MMGNCAWSLTGKGFDGFDGGEEGNVNLTALCNYYNKRCTKTTRDLIST